MINEEKLNNKIATLSEWLQNNHPHVVDEQCHLDNGEERAYWHYGYLMALRDIQNMLMD
jgi:hypothetical protein